MANLYYCDASAAAEFRVGAIIEISGEEARHAVRVARLRVGERIGVSDGHGAIGFGEAIHVDRERFAVRLTQVEFVAAASTEVVLVQALAKGDRAERAVEQATEFGVDSIVPWQADRSISRWDGPGGAEKAAKGVEKWTRIAREAAKQSVRARIPQVRDLASLADLCALAGEPGNRVIVLHPRGDQRLSTWAHSARSRGARCVFLIVGPEGGLSENELNELERAGAERLLLGGEVLRTSSAGPAALAVLNVSLHRW